MKIRLKDERLNERWRILVRSQTKAASPLAAGVGALPDSKSALAAIQAAWRFYNNDRIDLDELIEPLRECARERVARTASPFVLVAHDWCKLSFPGHSFREDVAELSNSSDVGYEVTMSLAVSADDGAPLAPVEMHLKTKEAVLSTQAGVVPARHLDQILPTMNAASGWNLGKPVLHIIDQEADSVGHWRTWAAAGHRLLIRGDDRVVEWEGQSRKLSKIRQDLEARGAFVDAGEARYHGRAARLRVAETSVILTRPARTKIGGKQVSVKGAPLLMRLIVTRVEDENGKLLASWLLLSNAPADWADAGRLAHCYYWRWRIESYFKLLKSHGFQLEDWLQETGAAIARRLLVASMAAVTVWQLLSDETAPAKELKTLLTRLSGRQMKRTKPFTAPALLAGLWMFLAMVDTLEQYDVAALRSLADKVQLPIPLFKRTD